MLPKKLVEEMYNLTKLVKGVVNSVTKEIRGGYKGYSIKDSKTFQVLSLLSKYFPQYEIKWVIIGGMAVQAHLYSHNLECSRRTRDIDIIIHNKYKEIFENSFLRGLSPIRYKSVTIFGKEGYKVYFKGGPPIGILFNETIPKYEKLKLRRGEEEIEIPVEEYEYLMIDKLKTFNERREKTDIIDIIDLLILQIERRIINIEMLEEAMRYYGVRRWEVREAIRRIRSYIIQRIENGK